MWFRSREKSIHWFPGSLIYAERWKPKFDLFLRAESKQYFEKIKILLGVNSIEELRKKFADIKAQNDLSQMRYSNAFESLPIESCLNIEKIATL